MSLRFLSRDSDSAATCVLSRDLDLNLTLVDNWIAQYGVEERAQKNRPFHLLKINLPMQNWNITT